MEEANIDITIEASANGTGIAPAPAAINDIDAINVLDFLFP